MLTKKEAAYLRRRIRNSRNATFREGWAEASGSSEKDAIAEGARKASELLEQAIKLFTVGDDDE